MRAPSLVSIVIACSWMACKCQCSGSASDGGLGGGAAGAGGRGGAGGTGAAGGAGGSGGSGGAVDAGDGTTHNPTGPGSGGPGFSLDGGDNSQGNGVTLSPDSGYLVLNSGSQEFYFMWIANNDQGWVSKYDTRTAREVGRYYSTIPKDCANSAGPPCTNGAAQPALTYNQGNDPSRTAVDIYGDVWVANRAVGHQGSVTKIANDIASCIDRNNNGKIDTSRDVNGDGRIDPTLCVNGECEMIIPPSPGDPLGYDECVLFSTPVGTNSGSDVAERGIAIARGIEGTAGDVWVVNHHESKVYKLSTANGQPLPVNAQADPSIQLQFKPYGMIVDGQQRLWVVRVTTAEVAIIDTRTGAVIAPSLVPPSGTACGAYALGIDGKDRLWLAGWGQGPVACRYDRSTDTWTRFDFGISTCVGGNNANFGRGRGIAADDQGQVYMSSDTGAQLIRFNADTGAVIPFGAAPCIDATDGDTHTSIGVGLDGDGHPWVNNHSGNAMKVDKVTGAVTRTAQQPSGLYTYSDFTGYQLRKFTAPRGTFRKDFEGCAAMTIWDKVAWTALTPAGTSVQVFIKVGATRAELDNTATMRFGPFTTSPVSLLQVGVPRARFIRVEFVLTSSNGMTTPVLQGFDVNWRCDIE